MKYTPEMAHAAVERGASWLDKNCPDWFKELDLEALSLSSSEQCVLGQTSECLVKNGGRLKAMTGYWRVIESRRINGFGSWPERHGFNIPEPASDNEAETAYEMLTIAWREYVRNRLAVPV